MDKEGWVKLHRKLLDNPIVCKDAEHLAIWIYLLLNATHTEFPAVFNGKKIMLQPGQLITGRKAIAEILNCDESKVQRVLKSFEIEQQIEQQTSTKNRLITVLSWHKYQLSEQQEEQQVNNKRTTTEQQLNTNKNVKNDKNERMEEEIKDSVRAKRFTPPTLDDVQAYCLERNKGVDATKWYNHYTANGWKVGKNKMQDWKAAVRTWEQNVKGGRRNERNGESSRRSADEFDYNQLSL